MGKEPQFPMLVMFLGKEAIDGYNRIANLLFDMWPSYKDELLFLGITERADGIEYSDLSILDGNVSLEAVSSGEIGNRVSALFGLKSHFQDRSRLLIYYVMDTTGFKDSSEFKRWITVMHNVRDIFVDRSLHTLDMLIVLLNENIGEKQVISAKIKNTLCHAKKELSFSTMLLSNRRSDHVILEDWETCYRVIADTIALTNNNETQVAGILFDNGVYTAAYACEEKPISKIGQVVIKQLIERLSHESFEAAGNILSDKQTAAKLGLSQERTLALLDSYAERTLFKMLPTSVQLQMFPRKDCTNYDDITLLSEKDFNFLTMECWNSFLDQIIVRTQENVHRDANMRASWKRQYSKLIAESFSINELVWLRDHIEDVKKYLTDAHAPSPDVQVLSAAKARIKYMLSSNLELIDIFVVAIKELGDNADNFLKEWRKLLESGVYVHSIRDENITQFYNRKIQDFFDHNGTEMSDTLKKIKDMGALAEYLDDIIDKIIKSDPVFSVPFEDELESRLQEEALPVNAKQYIRQKLTGESVPIYFQAQFNLGMPIVSCILIKVGTQLYSNLVNHLSGTTYYYDTGSSNSAEALNYYTVSADNLVSEEGML